MIEKSIVGIDVSKNTLDCCYLGETSSEFIQIANNVKGFKDLEKWLKSECKVTIDNCLICMEHTGLYNKPILNYLSKKKTLIWLESAIHIKRASGLVRGKNDKVDAERIAKYAQKNLDHFVEWQSPRHEVETLKALLTLRDKLVIQIKQLKVYINEYQSHGDKKIGKLLFSHTKKTRAALEKELKNLEESIHKIIRSDDKLNQLFTIITSVPGVGQVTAWLLLCDTNEFVRFGSARSLACHCGVAPFENSSGLSKGKARVSHLANKRLKTALHMAALSAVRVDGEMKNYYERKVEEGKNKMCVLNAVRNKLIHRIFSCQRDKRLFVKKVA